MTRIPEGGEAAACAVCKTACTVDFDSTVIACPKTHEPLAIVCDMCMSSGGADLAEFAPCPHAKANPCAECTDRIRAAAKEDRPSEEIIREDRDAWPDRQANDPIRAAAKEDRQP